jgi:hypothetical protein
MTVQAERIPREMVNDRPSRRRVPAGWVISALLLAVAGSAAGIVLGHRSPDRLPNPVLGHSLQPLAVYRVETPGSDLNAAARVVPDLGRPGHSTRMEKAPTFSLHVQYAYVRQVAGRWELVLTAPEGRAFNVNTTQGQFYDVLVHGQAVNLFFVAGTRAPGPDHGTNFAFGAGPNSMTRADAVRLAHTLSTSVRVA